MAPFSLVPAEVVDQISKFVPRSDLASLCLVNKSFHRSAELILYYEISIIWDHKHLNPPIIPLLRTLIRRPELLIRIDRLHLKGIYFDDDFDRPLLDTSGIPLDEFISSINKTDMPYISLWVDRLRSGSMDAFAGLLLAGLTKLSYLDITHNFINGDDILGKVLLSKVFGPLPQFERLKRVIYTKRLDRQVWERNEIFPQTMSLFYLPTTVKDIMVTMSNPEHFQWPGEEPYLTHLTSLKIGWCIEPFIWRILANTPNLKSLSWSWIYHDSPNEEWEEPLLDFDEITEGLLFVKDTLETFLFSMEIGGDGYERKIQDMEFSGSFRGLREMENLKFLSVPLVCLTGFEGEPMPLEQSIPTALEVIHLLWQDISSFGVEIEWYDEDLLGLVRPMLQPLVDQCPRLHLLTAVNGKLEIRTESCAPDCHP
ncbi:unnamed protein product [Clonostachys rosea]|uniref:F-box domain-containing protein n=1 Tax=Bionectria ochroleuca TaxID=29856 RepID=A0ABY6UMN7_BIOOC|nr:unnamed protein product [Clonostachys rosea]